MSKQDDHREDRPRDDNDALGPLLRSAGRGPRLTPEARERIYKDVHRQWSARWAAPAAPGSNVTPLRPRKEAPGRVKAARWLALAAGLAAVALVVVQLQSPIESTGQPFASIVRSEGAVVIVEAGGASHTVGEGETPSVRVGDVLVTEADGRLALELASGQQLRVNSRSRVRVADLDSIDLEVGTVYFDSMGVDTDFDVQTPQASVRHIGTQYEASVAAARLRVRVREGRTAIDNGSRRLEAAAGEQLQISAEGDVSRDAFATDDPAWQWTEQLAAITAAPAHNLFDVLTWASRETGVVLRFDDAATEARARDVEVTGLAGFGPREALEAIATTTSFRYRYGSGELVVTTAP